MSPNFKDLSLVNGSIVKTVKTEDLDIKEIVPIKFITKITTFRRQKSAFKKRAIVAAVLAAVIATGGIIAHELIAMGVMIGIVSAAIYVHYLKTRNIGLTIKFSQGDEFKYTYPYSTDDFKLLLAFSSHITDGISSVRELDTEQQAAPEPKILSRSLLKSS